MISFDECVDYIFNLPRKGKINDLASTKSVLDEFYKDNSIKIIHVAGTNGKGSVCAFLNSILINAGYKVGLFTSPHLIDVNERIKINNIDISDEDFVSSFSYVMDLLKAKDLIAGASFFEIVFLMAMRYFSINNTEYIILETGLGGRLDQTNCIGSKSLSIIAKLGLDHTEYLGDTLDKIAFEKAGIISKNTPVVYFDNHDGAENIIKKVASDNNSTCYSIKKEDITVKSVTKEGIDFSLANEYYYFDNVRINMVATYQTINAALAILAIKALNDSKITDDIILKSIKETKWAGRMEEVLPSIYVDGAHNEDGIKAFIESFKNMPHLSGKLKLIFSVVSDKDYDAMIKMIKEIDLFSEVYVCTIESKRALSLDKLKGAFKDYPDDKVFFYEKLEDAFINATKEFTKEDELYITGSLYLVGQIKSDIKSGVLNVRF